MIRDVNDIVYWSSDIEEDKDGTEREKGCRFLEREEEGRRGRGGSSCDICIDFDIFSFSFFPGDRDQRVCLRVPQRG